jgi:hypothetical protein
VEENFGVRVVGGESVALREKFTAKFGVVVNFAVEDDGRLAVGGGHRLRAVREVEDGQPAMSQKEVSVLFFKKAFGIRPAMSEAIRHAAKHRAVSRADESGDAAH